MICVIVLIEQGKQGSIVHGEDPRFFYGQIVQDPLEGPALFKKE